MSRVISSGPSFVSRASISNSSMWIEVNESSLHQLLGDEDRVLEVVAAPRHEGHEHVAAERQLAALGARAVGQHLTRLRPAALAHDGTLVDARVLIRALELGQRVDVGAEVLAALGADAHDDALRVDQIDDARRAGR